GVEVGVELLLDAVDVGQKAVVAEQFLEAGLRDAAEQLDGAVPALLPQVDVDAAEQGDAVVAPAEPEVVGELVQRLQPGGQARQDGESADRTRGHETSS